MLVTFCFDCCLCCLHTYVFCWYPTPKIHPFSNLWNFTKMYSPSWTKWNLQIRDVFLFTLFFSMEALENGWFPKFHFLHLQILQNPWKSKTKQSGWSLGFFYIKDSRSYQWASRLVDPRPLPREMSLQLFGKGRNLRGLYLGKSFGTIGAPEPEGGSESRMIFFMMFIMEICWKSLMIFMILMIMMMNGRYV